MGIEAFKTLKIAKWPEKWRTCRNHSVNLLFHYHESYAVRVAGNNCPFFRFLSTEWIVINLLVVVSVFKTLVARKEHKQQEIWTSERARGFLLGHSRSQKSRIAARCFTNQYYKKVDKSVHTPTNFSKKLDLQCDTLLDF